VAKQISIGTFPSRIEAETVQGRLASAGIAAWVATDDAGGAYPFDLSGGAQVLIDESDLEQPRRFLPPEPTRLEPRRWSKDGVSR
jgi:hypothetical protein